MEIHRGGLRCATARARVNDEETPQSLPRGARMILTDYSDKEPVKSRKQGLVFTLIPFIINSISAFFLSSFPLRIYGDPLLLVGYLSIK